ncbi:dihydrofolate reductase [Sinomonas sp. JGH33]|uniref:Dihydrofolate reductase n=1 Tax=Sinomonas terricola TaxID=3110330 RepID=A0ABU5T1K4_9MICC|nr:dihydrofolate reductase [Sinomonas sp. JGH33]MEA5453534.1 dihydrofolate reductase [Sinomonas sp. JGH33]
MSPQAANQTEGVGLIWAQTHSGVIGRDGTMPWHVPEDMAHFASVTKGHPVVMGRKTWDSIPVRFRPFSDRTNIVVTRRQGWAAGGAVVVHSLEEALAAAASAPGGTRTWLIGGGELFGQALDLDAVNIAVVTYLDLELDGDAFAPKLGPEWVLASSEPVEGAWLASRTGVRYRIAVYRR